jgi:N-acetylneuraminic acid mutarotase
MIVWGGYGDADFNTGGRYDPATDNWTPTNTLNAPSPRHLHTALWTGSEMIVWGGGVGYPFPDTYFNSGGRYDPITDSWTRTSTLSAPSPRHLHSAVWTESEMIVWGGYSFPPDSYLNTGGRYDLATDSWRPTSMVNAPSSRRAHTAVWTQSEMIVWGGGNANSVFETGGRYCAVKADSVKARAVLKANSKAAR